MAGQTSSSSDMNLNTPDAILARFIDLSRAMGEALWCIQGVEDILAKHYVVACKLSGNEPEEDMNAHFEEQFRNTLGRMVKVFKKDSTPSDELSQRLDRFTFERNWLVHRFRREEYGKLVSPSSFPNLIKRVLDLRDEAEALTQLFNQMMIDHFVRLGCDPSLIHETLEAEEKRLMNPDNYPADPTVQ